MVWLTILFNLLKYILLPMYLVLPLPSRHILQQLELPSVTMIPLVRNCLPIPTCNVGKLWNIAVIKLLTFYDTRTGTGASDINRLPTARVTRTIHLPLTIPTPNTTTDPRQPNYLGPLLPNLATSLLLGNPRAPVLAKKKILLHTRLVLPSVKFLPLLLKSFGRSVLSRVAELTSNLLFLPDPMTW